MEPKDRIETLVKTKVSSMKERVSGNMMSGRAATGAQYQVPQEELEALLVERPAAPKKTAELLIQQYGSPNEATPTLLIWHENGPWKRMEITRDEGAHDFPTPHTDYIAQTIDYFVPVEGLTQGQLAVNLGVRRDVVDDLRARVKRVDGGVVEEPRR
ncbi:MAG: hypothetical protein M3M94_07665 [Actinomycetota bacterium]|nr:hypothetical protein [Actinomycetota bacterium]